jgi:hypothetical protein
VVGQLPWLPLHIGLGSEIFSVDLGSLACIENEIRLEIKIVKVNKLTAILRSILLLYNRYFEL